MDETWANHFDPETKLQIMQWKHKTSLPPVKFGKMATAGKVMAMVFWDSEGVLMTDYLERGNIGGILTSVGWQVTLCDPIWHVSFP